jgi:P2 family phage contractile tail tube protein
MIPQTLTNMNLHVDGIAYNGKVKELNLPKLKRKTEDHRAGGMDAPVSIGLGLELIEADFTTTGIDIDLLKFFGVADDTATNAVFRGAFKQLTGEVVPAIATFRGMIKEFDPGSWKSGEPNENKFSLSGTYYKLEVDNTVVYEIDPVACIRVINGKDEAAEERAAIGM